MGARDAFLRTTQAPLHKEIAEHFEISEDTVKKHLSNIFFDKLGVSSRMELPRFAVNQGIPLYPSG